MQYQHLGHQASPHPGNLSNLGHSEHYTLSSSHGGHPSASKPRSRTHMDMEGEEDLDVEPHHNQHHLHTPQHSHHIAHQSSHHHLSSHQPPPAKMQRSDYAIDDIIGRSSISNQGSLMPNPSPMQPGVQQHSNQIYGGPLGSGGHLTPLAPPDSLRQHNGMSSSHMIHHGTPGSQQILNQNPSNVGGVGTPGMPLPMPRPRGPKLKFTPEDDALLVDLKENRALTWKQIAEFFPGRSSGTLQVRYCTKLKAKTTQWTDDTVQRLRNAMQEYENDRWRLIAAKVGNGFSPAACREKAREV